MSLTASDLELIRSVVTDVIEPIKGELEAQGNDIKEVYNMLGAKQDKAVANEQYLELKSDIKELRQETQKQFKDVAEQFKDIREQFKGIGDQFKKVRSDMNSQYKSLQVELHQFVADFR